MSPFGTLPLQIAGCTLGEVVAAAPASWLLAGQEASGRRVLLSLALADTPEREEALSRDLEAWEARAHSTCLPHRARGGSGGAVWILHDDQGATPPRALAPAPPGAALALTVQAAQGLLEATRAGLPPSPLAVRVDSRGERLRLAGMESCRLRLPAAQPLLADLLFELLTGATPAEGGVRRWRPDLPLALDWLEGRLRRAAFSSLEETLAAIERIQAEEDTAEAGPPPLPSWLEEVPAPPAPPRAQVPWKGLLASLGALGGLLALLGGPWELSRPASPTQEVPPPASAPAPPATPERGALRFDGARLKPAGIRVKVRVFRGARVLVEEELPGGRGVIELPLGELLELELSAPGHLPRRRKVLLTEAEPQQDHQILLFPDSTVTLATRPGALVRLDGSPVGIADEGGYMKIPPLFLEVGRAFTVSASLPGHATRELRFTVKPGLGVLHLDLEADPEAAPRPDAQPGPARPAAPDRSREPRTSSGGTRTAPTPRPAPPGSRPSSPPPSSPTPPPSPDATRPPAPPAEPDLPILLPDH